MTVLYIVLFILFLLILVLLHELGHFIAAKAFKVYCFEFAIGFGPKVFSFRRKQGETYFSLRAIPFGGFVSMYGEEESVPEELKEKIDPKRSILAIKKWKRAIIMVAGVVMNFITAILMFFVYEVAFPQLYPHYGHIVVNENSLASSIGLKNNDFFYSQIAVDESGNEYVIYDSNALITYSDSTSETAYFGYSYTNATPKDPSLYTLSSAFSKKSVDSFVDTYESEASISQIKDGSLDANKNYLVSGYLITMGVDEDIPEHMFAFVSDKVNDSILNAIVINISLNTENKKTIPLIPLGDKVSFIAQVDEEISFNIGAFKQVSVVGNNYRYNYADMSKGDLLTTNNEKVPEKLNFSLQLIEEETHSFLEKKSFESLALTANGSKYKLPNNIGISMQIETQMNGFGKALGNTFSDFGKSSTLIFQSLGSLFTDASAWSQVGGIISIGVVSSKQLEDYGFGRYLFFWALISVNLGIINLLPFPGLDGWHLLVIAVEGIFKKEIPAKVKNIVALVGLILLFGLMIAVLIKDVVGLFI